MYSSTVNFQPHTVVLRLPVRNKFFSSTYLYFPALVSCSVCFVFQLEVTVISEHNYFLASLGWSEFSCLSWLILYIKQNNVHKDPGHEAKNPSKTMLYNVRYCWMLYNVKNIKANSNSEHKVLYIWQLWSVQHHLGMSQECVFKLPSCLNNVCVKFKLKCSIFSL